MRIVCIPYSWRDGINQNAAAEVMVLPRATTNDQALGEGLRMQDVIAQAVPSAEFGPISVYGTGGLGGLIPTFEDLRDRLLGDR